MKILLCNVERKISRVNILKMEKLIRVIIKVVEIIMSWRVGMLMIKVVCKLVVFFWYM